MRIMKIEGNEDKGDENEDKEGDERASMKTEPRHH